MEEPTTQERFATVTRAACELTATNSAPGSEVRQALVCQLAEAVWALANATRKPTS